MYNEAFQSVIEQSQQFVTPVVKANKLAVATIEKVVGFQLNALQAYVDLGLGQLKAASEINDPASLQAFVNSQIEVSNQVRQKLVDDGNALVELGNVIKADYQKLAEEAVVTLTPKAPKAAAKKAPAAAA